MPARARGAVALTAAVAVCACDAEAARALRGQAKLATTPPRRQNQARLANARRALEQQQRTSPGDRLTQPPVDPGESGVSVQKRLPTIHRDPGADRAAAKIPSSTRQKQVVLYGAAANRPRKP